ncbi:MAG: hypothetical protein KatS3mg042_0671 [Rhodothermaceae bacterium]|nr:MAG: hypothetical protein KatS3mg042_0671 [Rhodothermaceae bacterium]
MRYMYLVLPTGRVLTGPVHHPDEDPTPLQGLMWVLERHVDPDAREVEPRGVVKQNAGWLAVGRDRLILVMR